MFMQIKSCSDGFWLASNVALLCLAIASPIQAQITPDTTLPVNSTITPAGNTFTIEGGTTAGSNLFHSFREFSVPTGAEAFFNNAANIQNIFSRVTGGNLSNIDGLIRANGTANLFLLNPNGIIFGSNARLNIGGSFLATTASSFRFADGTEFSANNPQNSPLLTISVPIGLQYGSKSGEIRVEGLGQNFAATGAITKFPSSLNPLEVKAGNTLTFVGGNVIIDGGILQAEGGRIELGGLVGEGTVNINSDRSLSFPDGVARGDVFIINQAGINAIAAKGGSIAITAKNIDIQDSLLMTGIAQGLGSTGSMAGDLTLNATETINIASSSIRDVVGVNGIGNSGDINIQTGSLSVTDGSVLVASTVGKGDAGDINILARDTVSFKGTDAASLVLGVATGKGGNINITTGSLFVTDGGQINASTSGKGDAGNVTIVARDRVSFDGAFQDFSSGTNSIVGSKAQGNGGKITISTGTLSLTNGAILAVDTNGKGNAGTISITARDTVTVDGFGMINSEIRSILGATAIGKGGNINITASSVSVTGGGQLLAETRGKGDAGSITIAASDRVAFDGVDSEGLFRSAAFTTVSSVDAEGNGGNIYIETGSLSITNGAQLLANTRGKGNAGNVTIIARDRITLDGTGLALSGDILTSISGILSNVGPFAEGEGGDIRIETNSLFVTNGAGLRSLTEGVGNAGNVTIIASDTVVFDGVGLLIPTSIASSVFKADAGNGGDIYIETKSLSVTNGAQLIADTQGKGDAGNITIIARDRVTFDGTAGNGNVVSAAFTTVEETAAGNGGDINITTNLLTLSNDAGLFASSRSDQRTAGNINITADAIRLDNQANIAANTKGGEGNINLRSPTITLRRNSSITTDATGGKFGGDVVVRSQFLQLREGSFITTNAIGEEITGGNIRIDSDIIAALENSDISANSENFRGGTVTINTQGIFGTEFRQQQTSFSDITATGANSELSGEVTINTPEVDPSSGLIELPDNVVDITGLVDQQCSRQARRSSFVVIGRGGIPEGPDDPLSPEGYLVDLVTINTAERREGENVRSDAQHLPRTQLPTEIVEATGWYTNEKGEVVLTASTPSIILYRSWQTQPLCR